MRLAVSRVCRALLAPAVLALAACGTAGGPATATSSPTTVPVAETPPSRAAAPTAGESSSWTMPSLVGSNLQDAQDAIQALTDNKIFVTRSHDATGGGRQQVLDRNWKVCTQNVPPGTTITAETVIDFGAAKLSEPC